MDGIKAEKDDKIIAIGKYHTMAKLVGGDPKTEAYARIARNRAARLESMIGEDEKVALVQRALRRAEREWQAGRVGNARGIWLGVIDTYGDSSELAAPRSVRCARLNDREPRLSISAKTSRSKMEVDQPSRDRDAHFQPVRSRSLTVAAQKDNTQQRDSRIHGCMSRAAHARMDRRRRRGSALLDQTRLPLEEVTIDCREPRTTCGRR